MYVFSTHTAARWSYETEHWTWNIELEKNAQMEG